MTSQIFFAILYLVISLASGLLFTFGTYRIFIRLIRRRYNITPKNISFALLSASVIFSVCYIIAGVLDTVFKMISTLRATANDGSSIFLDVMKYGTLFMGLGFVISFLVILLAMYIFNFINTEIDELQEVSDNNIAVGILLGVIIITITMFVKGSIVFLLENLIPYPKLPFRT